MFGKKKKIYKEVIYIGDYAEVKQLMKDIGFEYSFESKKSINFERNDETIEISKISSSIKEYRSGFELGSRLSIEDLTQILKALQTINTELTNNE